MPVQPFLPLTAPLDDRSMNAAPFHNPHSAALATYYAVLDEALHTVRTLAADLQWFDQFDVLAVDQILSDHGQQREQVARAVQQAVIAKAALPAPSTLSVMARMVPWLVNSPAARVNEALRAEHERLTLALSQGQRRVAAIDVSAAAWRDELALHAAFDHEAVCARLAQARVDRDAAESHLQQAVRDHAAAEQLLAPLIAQLQAAEAAEAALRADLATAEDFQRQLAAAPSPAARGPIHGACTERFGTGNPGKLIETFRRKIEAAARTTAKCRERYTSEAADAALVIDHLVVDASNLCYRNDGGHRTFIGLVALDALVPMLAARYRTTLVFDASTQRRLDTTARDLKERFGNGVEVQVTHASRSADRTLLSYASSPTSYALTNDRVRDFTDLPVVKEGRVLRFHQMERMVEIPRLNVTAHFHQASQP
jgi:hypothetical protein